MRSYIKFGPWQPDRANTEGTNLETADNVLPVVDGWSPMPSFVAVAGIALPASPYGGVSVKGTDGLPTTFIGTATNLYRLDAPNWTSVGGGYQANDSHPWNFVQFGNRLIATNGSDAPQFVNLGTASNFAVLPGNGDEAPPKAKFYAVVRDFLVGGYVEDNALRVQWSGVNNSSEWRVGYSQSDYNIFPDGGEVTALSNGEVGLVFQTECIRRMDYVGGDVIFQFNVVSPDIGCVHPRAYCQVGSRCFFLSSRGFMMWDGGQVVPIGDEIVDRAWADVAEPAYYARMSCISDPVRKVVYWSAPSAGPDTWFCYHWGLQRWSQVTQSARLMFAGLSRPATMDEEIGSPDLGDDGLPFDDPSYLGGEPTFYIVDGDNTLGAMSGPPMEATLTMGPLPLANGAQTRIRRCRLDSDATAGLTLSLDGRQRTGDPANVTTHTGPVATGDVIARRRARVITASWTIAAGTVWSFANGFAVEFEKGGFR